MKKLKYQNGGKIKPNMQRLGNIEFDSGGTLGLINSLGGAAMSTGNPYAMAGGALLQVGTGIYSMIDAKKKAQEAKSMQELSPSNYQNKNAFGFEDGGVISNDLTHQANQAYEVTGGAGGVDKAQAVVQGVPVKLNKGEILDGTRVISTHVPQILKGYKSLINQEKSLKTKINSTTGQSSDPLVNTAKDMITKQKDSLFNLQEALMMQAGKRNPDGSTVQDNQGMKYGGAMKFGPGGDALKTYIASLPSKEKAAFVMKFQQSYNQVAKMAGKPLLKIDGVIGSQTLTAADQEAGLRIMKDVPGINLPQAAPTSYQERIAQDHTKQMAQMLTGTPGLTEESIKEQTSNKLNNLSVVPTIPNAMIQPDFKDPKTGMIVSEQDPIKRIAIQQGLDPDKFSNALAVNQMNPKDREKYLNNLAVSKGGTYQPVGSKQVWDIDSEGNEYQKTISTPEQLIPGALPELSKTLVTDTMKGIATGSPSDTEKKGLFGNMTAGEKIGAGAGALSLLGKGIMAFQKPAKEQRYYNTVPISLQQMDPRYALNNSNQQAQAQLNNINNETGTYSARQAAAQGLYSRRTAVDNDILSKYQDQNQQLRSQYEQQLGQRSDQNAGRAAQYDQLDAQNKGAARNMQMGFLGDVATYGSNIGKMMNDRKANQMGTDAIKTINSDVWANLAKAMKIQYGGDINKIKTKKK